MASPCWNPFPIVFREADDDPASGALAYFFYATTTTPLTTYTNAVRSSVHEHPVVASAAGVFAPIYLEPGIDYKVRINDALGNILYEVDNIFNPPIVDEGGGGGIVVTAAQVHQVGDVIWNAAGGERTGWVRSNGRTIGSAASTATERINDDTADLYAFLWNNFPDTICAVAGGRGATPTADFGANKVIATIDMRGHGIAGLDNMGTTARNLVQKTTTITTTNTSTAATVPSTTGLCAGMFVKATSTTAATKIASVNSGTSITLTVAATATAAGTAARFSMFSDAELQGSAGGENIHSVTVAELPAHTHANTVGATASSTSTVNDPTHFHYVTTDADTSNMLVGRETAGTPAATFDQQSGANNDSISVAAIAAANVTGITVSTSTTVSPTISNASVGSSMPINIQTPAVLGTFYMKL